MTGLHFPNFLVHILCLKTNCREFPKCEYVGRTTRPFWTFLGEHKQYIAANMLFLNGEIYYKRRIIKSYH